MRSALMIRTGALAFALLTTSAAVSLADETDAAQPDFDITTAVEARRVDRVDVSRVEFKPCKESYARGLDCAAVTVPADYDEPDGGTYTLNVVRRVNPDNPDAPVVFVNPGGPGGSAAGYVTRAHPYLRDNVTLVGVDPRGVGFFNRKDPLGQVARCFDNDADHVEPDLKKSTPYTSAETVAIIKSVQAFASACTRQKDNPGGTMSTAQTARDMDVVRRALREDTLDYVGFSYGTYLGQVYANLFPDRVGRMVLDSMLDPVHYLGLRHLAAIPFGERTWSGKGSERALEEIWRLCDVAGPEKCPAAPNSRQRFQELSNHLAAHGPMSHTFNGRTVSIDHQGLHFALFRDLRRSSPTGYVGAIRFWHMKAFGQSRIQSMEEPPMTALQRLQDEATSAPEALFGNGVHFSDASTTILCSESRNAYSSMEVARVSKAARDRGQPLHQFWTWRFAECSADLWSLRDEDAYRGPFNRRPRHPLLMMTNRWDGSTALENQTAAAARQQKAHTLINEGFGHIATSASQCAKDAMVNYLTTGTLPAHDRCTDVPKPFGQQANPEGYNWDPAEFVAVVPAVADASAAATDVRRPAIVSGTTTAV